MGKVTTLIKIGLVFCLVFGACASESEDNTKTGPALLRKIECDVMANHSEYNFYYEGRKLAVVAYDLEITATGMTSIKGYDKYYYTDELITAIRTYNETDQIIAQKKFTYDENGRLLQEIALNIENNTGLKNVFIYNGNGTVEVQRFHGDLNSQTTYADSDMFYLENGEIVQYDYHSGANVDSYEFEYDQGNNPMKNIIGMDKIKLCRYESNGWYGIAKNMKKITSHFSGESAASQVEFDIFYNAENYPVSAISTADSPGPFSFRYEYY
nr:hypothetical protein [uncultured Flavobacterium sp.]